MAVTMLCEIGPCDDNAYLYLNGRLLVQTGLGETRQFRRDLEDGDYNVRFQVINSGGWAWRAKLALNVGGKDLADIDEVGGSGLYTGEVYEKEWQFRIEGGKLTEF